MRNLIDRNKPFQETLFILTAIITGLSIPMLWFTTPPYGWNPYETSLLQYAATEWDTHYMNYLLFAMPFISTTIFLGTRRLLRALVKMNFPSGDSIDLYSRHDTKTYYVFTLLLLAIFGVYLQLFIVFLLFILLQVALLFTILNKNKELVDNDLTRNSRILLLFFISGFSALIYQIAWQRKLFQSFGVNIESVTIIVSIFMLGLGIGAVIGGVVSKRFPAALLKIFLISELLIGVFGLFSLRLIEYVNSLTLHSSLLVISLSIYALLLLPTALMGATLPILVSHLYDNIKNVGKSVSVLYCVNTLGSAFAAFATIHVLFYLTGLGNSVRIAAILNFSVAFLGFAFIHNIKTAEFVTHPGKSPTEHTVSDQRQILIWALSFIIGYISLSQEILWVRLASYATGSKATVFGNVVGCFLVGIALGAWHAKKICEKNEKEGKIISLTGALLVVASLVYYLMIPLLSWLATILWKGVFPPLYIGVGIVSYLMGAIFPMLCHYAARSRKDVGLSLSGVYFFNILGSTTGPVVTGFFLLDRFPIETNILILSLVTFILGSSLWISSKADSISRRTAYTIGAGSIVVFLLHPIMYHHLLERFYFKHKYHNQPPFKYTYQNRSGIINVIPSDKGDDIIIGGGIYDGRINTSLTNNRNGIDRAYMIAALHPKPSECLQIGLSGGSWARVVANHSEVKSLDIVEINPAYIDIIKNYRENISLLKDPRIAIHIGDGRRWMLKNEGRKFDIIFMNIYYWLEHMSDLVSKDFLLLAKRHLKDGGVIYFNTTGSIDIPYTTAHVFKYVTTYGNFIAASDSPFPEDFELKKNSLEKFSLDGRPVFDPENRFLQNELHTLAAYDLSNRRARISQGSDLSYLITDDNLASEFKTGKKLFSFRRNWLQLIFH